MTDRTDEHADEPSRTMADVSHTNPNTGDTFGTVYRRGPAVADGGERRDAAESGEKTMSDVNHESPNSDVAGVWERGSVTEADDVSDGQAESDEPKASDD